MDPRCVVVVPVYAATLTPDEERSIEHLKRFLGGFDICVAAPEGLRLDALPFRYMHFEAERFASRDSYSRMLLSEDFYSAFASYSHMLIYQLDCLVFSDSLGTWLDAGYDYIGAPLFHNMNNPEMGFSRVGNGGLSLRRIEAFLQVIQSRRYDRNSPALAVELFTVHLPDLGSRGMIGKLKKTAEVLRSARRGSLAYRMSYSLNEDLFWSDRAKLFYPEFNIAPVEKGLQFAFEMHPRYCYRRNGEMLPFGCHAWIKWDRDFWNAFMPDL